MAIVDRNKKSLIQSIVVSDDSGTPQLGILDSVSTTTFRMEYLELSTGTWTLIPLAAMTPGNWVSGGWYETGNGSYLFGVPNDLVSAGENLPIRYVLSDTYRSYDTISYTSGTSAEVDTTDVTSAVIEALSGASGATYFPITSSSNIVIGDDHDADNDRGAIGPYRISTKLDLRNDTAGNDVVAIRSGFARKTGSGFSSNTTDQFQGGAYAVAVDGEDYTDPTATRQYDIYIEVPATATYGKRPGIYGADVEAVQQVDTSEYDVVTLMRTEINVVQSFGGYPATYTP